MEIDFREVYDDRPTSELLDEEIYISVVGDIRCIYVKNTRVAGGKPYISENLSRKDKKTNVREVLDAFTIEELQAAIYERKERAAYLAAYHKTKDTIKKAEPA